MIYENPNLQLEIISISAQNDNPAGAVVVLHGWGSNHHDIDELVPDINLPEYQLLFPNGLYDHDYNEKGKMWYSFAGAGRLSDRSLEQLANSRRILTEWIQSLPTTTGVPLDRTWIGGFSQGGAMTLDIGLDLPVAGLIALSGYLHPERPKPLQATPPVLVVHGRQDDIVPLAAAHHTRDVLTQWGVDIEYREFDMGHSIVPEVLQLIRQYITSRS